MSYWPVQTGPGFEKAVLCTCRVFVVFACGISSVSKKWISFSFWKSAVWGRNGSSQTCCTTYKTYRVTERNNVSWMKETHTYYDDIVFSNVFLKKHYIPPWASFHKHLHKEGTEGDGDHSVSWVRDSTPPREHQLQLEQHSDLKKQDEELHFTQSSAVTLCASGDIWRMCLSVQN